MRLSYAIVSDYTPNPVYEYIHEASHLSFLKKFERIWCLARERWEHIENDRATHKGCSEGATGLCMSCHQEPITGHLCGTITTRRIDHTKRNAHLVTRN